MSRESDLRQIGDEARAAFAREQEFFVAKLASSLWKGTPRGEVEPWSIALQVVESAGWQLEHWAVASDGGSGTSAFPVFRRRDTRRLGGPAPSPDTAGYEPSS